MAKKYLNQDEAAIRLGISVEELNAVREAGDLRGFADRGTWKFKEDDVEELVRSRQVGSDPDIPMLSDSAIEGDEDEVGSRETVIRNDSVFDDDEPGVPGPSDSDVRLILDDSLRAGDDFDAHDHATDNDIPLIEAPGKAGSDSDVKLVDGDPGGSNVLAGRDSDSDVQLAGQSDLLAETDAGDIRLTRDSNLLEGTDPDVRLARDSDVLASGDGDDLRLSRDSGLSTSDSDSDVRLVAPEGIDDGSTDSDVRLVGADSDSDVRLSTPGGLMDTESDVRLVGSSGVLVRGRDDAKDGDSDSDVQLVDDGDSDSDVKLAADPGSAVAGTDSDSDVQIAADPGATLLDGVDSDSDVQLAGPADDGGATMIEFDVDDSDSDVKLVPDAVDDPPGSDSDVQLIGSGLLPGSDSDVKLVDSKGTDRPGSDSDVALVSADGSGLLLDDDESSVFADDGSEDDDATFAAGSGIFSPNDSGINLEVQDSGIVLEDEGSSGIALDAGDDFSGIALDEDASGIALDDASSAITLADDASSIALDLDAATDRTVNEMEAVDFAADDHTQADMEAFDGEDTFKLADDRTGEGDVILFEDEDADDYTAAVVKQGSGGDEAEDTFNLAGDEYEDEGEYEDEYDEFDDDELEVAADIEGEDDELDDLDVFDEVDDFDDDFDEGGLAAPAERMAAPVEAEWGWPTFAGLLLTFGLLSFGGVLMYDLVRAMWVVDGPTAAGTDLLDWFASMFTG